ncbi:PREDICTED: uncharacterized protein LOC105954240 [Erythranthe guttata]|uniref:uncharacterized protein LOC105954240 n=1 Tax=Erythranthe guttata TaxID=4155 RepID=UPI00064D74CF|nr:PREDICTED: uncharacterized protein LOC105954240 [Erythranthe guttata]|eukprot:XP_012833368.1 PREDICTED: uncharacterized protein LOC105954240 [Erythranthe guttata]
MSIAELVDTLDSTVVLLATIFEIDLEKRWWYISCKNCKKKVTPNGSKYFYKRCDRDVPTIPRYRIEVTIVDSTSSTSLVLFDEMVKQFIGKSASEVVGNMKKEQLSNTLPVEFQMLVNKEFLFKIQISEMNVKKNWSLSTVKTMTNDKEKIQKFKSGMKALDEEDDQDFHPIDDDAIPVSKSCDKRFVDELTTSSSSSDADVNTQSSTTVVYCKRIKLEKYSKMKSSSNELSNSIVTDLKDMLDQYNLYAQSYRMVRDKIQSPAFR